MLTQARQTAPVPRRPPHGPRLSGVHEGTCEIGTGCGCMQQRVYEGESGISTLIYVQRLNKARPGHSAGCTLITTVTEHNSYLDEGMITQCCAHTVL